MKTRPNTFATVGTFAVIRFVVLDLVEYGALAHVDIVASQDVQNAFYFPGSDPAALQKAGVRTVAVQIIQGPLSWQCFAALLIQQDPGIGLGGDFQTYPGRKALFESAKA